MGSAHAQRKFPDEKQRLAAAFGIFRKHRKAMHAKKQIPTTAIDTTTDTTDTMAQNAPAPAAPAMTFVGQGGTISEKPSSTVSAFKGKVKYGKKQGTTSGVDIGVNTGGFTTSGGTTSAPESAGTISSMLTSPGIDNLGGGKLGPFKSHKVKFLDHDSGIEALDAPPRDIALDKAKMCARGLLATNARDRQGDIMEIGGILTANHRRNPIALLDHGKHFPLPIGKTLTPDGEYTVICDEDAGECWDEIYFSQILPEAEQAFYLIDEGILQGKSIGFRPINVRRLAPDPQTGHSAGKHLISVELLESTICPIPVNQECTGLETIGKAMELCRTILGRNKIEGRRLAPCIKSMLTSFSPLSQTSWANGAELPMQTKSSMSAIDETTGGALRNNDEGNKTMKKKSATDQTKMTGDAHKKVGAGEGEQSEIRENSDDGGLNAKVKSDKPSARCMRDFHHDMNMMHHVYQPHIGELEHPHIPKMMHGHLDTIQKIIGNLVEEFERHHPDHHPLHFKAEEADEGQGGPEGGEETPESDELEHKLEHDEDIGGMADDKAYGSEAPPIDVHRAAPPRQKSYSTQGGTGTAPSNLTATEGSRGHHFNPADVEEFSHALKALNELANHESLPTSMKFALKGIHSHFHGHHKKYMCKDLHHAAADDPAQERMAEDIADQDVGEGTTHHDREHEYKSWDAEWNKLSPEEQEVFQMELKAEKRRVARETEMIERNQRKGLLPAAS